MSTDSAMSEGNDTTRKSNKNYDKSLLLENTLLNETLEKERSKRKVCIYCKFKLVLIQTTNNNS